MPNALQTLLSFCSTTCLVCGWASMETPWSLFNRFTSAHLLVGKNVPLLPSHQAKHLTFRDDVYVVFSTIVYWS